MDQLPNLGREQEMLSIMGLNSIEDLFSNIPEEVRRKDPLPLPPPQSEEEIWRDAQHLLGSNINLDSRPSFLSAGLSRNFVPTMVGMLATRGEFRLLTHLIKLKSVKVCFKQCGNPKPWFLN